MEKPLPKFVVTAEGLRYTHPLHVDTSDLRSVCAQPSHHVYMHVRYTAQSFPEERSLPTADCILVTSGAKALQDRTNVACLIEELDVAILHVDGETNDRITLDNFVNSTISVPMSELGPPTFYDVKTFNVVYVVSFTDPNTQEVHGVPALASFDKAEWNVFFGTTRIPLSLPVCTELRGRLILLGNTGRPFAMYTHDADRSYAIPLETINRVFAVRRQHYDLVRVRPNGFNGSEKVHLVEPQLPFFRAMKTRSGFEVLTNLENLDEDTKHAYAEALCCSQTKWLTPPLTFLGLPQPGGATPGFYMRYPVEAHIECVYPYALIFGLGPLCRVKVLDGDSPLAHVMYRDLHAFLHAVNGVPASDFKTALDLRNHFHDAVRLLKFNNKAPEVAIEVVFQGFGSHLKLIGTHLPFQQRNTLRQLRSGNHGNGRAKTS